MDVSDVAVNRYAAVVADHVRAERARAGLSQAALAKAAGLHFNTISYIETGRRHATVDQIFLISRVLGSPSPGRFFLAAEANARPR